MVVLCSWYYGVQDISMSFKNKAEKKHVKVSIIYINVDSLFLNSLISYHSFFFFFFFLNVDNSIPMRSF